MVSPQNPNPTVGQNVAPTTTGRGFVAPEQTHAAVYQPEGMGISLRSRVSWGSVIAGSLLSISLLALFGSLGYALGIPAFGAGQYGWGAGIWSILSSALAFYAGGCVSAYMAGHADRPYNALLHGVMAWVLTIPLVMIFFAGPQGQFGQGGLIATNIVRILLTGAPIATNNAVITAASTAGDIRGLNLTGAAWGAWLSLFVGLICAALGGSSVDRRTTGERHTAMERAS